MNVAPPTSPAERPATRRREATRARILDAATAMLLADGLGSLSLHRLAAELDFTTSALYRYFPSKDALLAEVVAALLATVAHDLRAASARLGGASPLARLRAVVLRWVALASEDGDPHRFNLIQQLFATPERVFAEAAHAEAAVDAMFEALSPVTAGLAEAADAGLLEPGDAEARALIVFASVEGLLLLRKQAARAPRRLDPEALVAPALDALLRGWGASSSAPCA